MTALLDAVDDLTLPRNVKVQIDGGFTWATEDALLVQLEESIHSTMGRTGGRGGGDSRMILDADALMRFSQIGSVIMDWCRMVRAHVSKNPSEDLRAWYVAYSATPGEQLDAFYIKQLVKWADLIRGKLNPRETIEFTDPCPECREGDWVNEDGELIPNPVTIDYDKSGDVLNDAKASCRACGHTWQGVWELRGMRHAADEMSEQGSE